LRSIGGRMSKDGSKEAERSGKGAKTEKEENSQDERMMG